MKKVLFLLEGFNKGGIEKVTLDIVNHLDPEKYDITVQTFWYGGHCQSLVNPNIKVKPFFFKRYVRGIIRLVEYLSPKMLYRLFVHGDYDIEIAASDGGAAKVISGSTNKKAKKICWVHMDVINRGSGLAELQNPETAQKIYGKFDVIVPVSEACKKQFERKFGTSYHMTVKYNPLPVYEILQNAEEKMSIAYSSVFNFVSVGRIEDQKGYDRLVEACKELVKLCTIPFHVYIIGTGTKTTAVASLASSYGMTDIITFLGFYSNPYPYVKNATMYIMSSRDEAYPLVIGESLIVGTPVLATDCAGVSEWLQNGKVGMIMENSTEGILQGMRRVLEDPELVEHYRRETGIARENISFERTLKEFEELLND